MPFPGMEVTSKINSEQAGGTLDMTPQLELPCLIKIET